MNKTKQLNLRNCPENVHQALKILAAEKKKSLQDLIIEILKKHLKDNK